MTARSVIARPFPHPVTARPIPRAVIANPPHHPVIASPPLHPVIASPPHHPVIASPKGVAIQGRWGDLVGLERQNPGLPRRLRLLAMTARSVTARPIPRAVIANPPHHPVIASPPLHPVIASPKGVAIQGRWGGPSRVERQNPGLPRRLRLLAMTARSVIAGPIPALSSRARPPPVIASPKGVAIQGRWGGLVGLKGKTLDCRVGCASSQ
jgi:hypothetical protein